MCLIIAHLSSVSVLPPQDPREKTRAKEQHASEIGYDSMVGWLS